LGCTGVEDELQDEVASTIEDFKAAGIKVWILTGDLGHTAQEIGYNCGVMSRDQSKAELFELKKVQEAEVMTTATQVRESSKQGKDTTVMISGQAFSEVGLLEEKCLSVLVNDVLLAADSVIFYRLSPS